MITYLEIHFNEISPETSDVLVARLPELGFSGMEETPTGLKAYATAGQVDLSALDAICAEMGINYTNAELKEENWNSSWESNFDPVILPGKIHVRAHFHPTIEGFDHEILITPKMSFGTGHHGTTYSVMQLMRGIDFTNKSVFDFGTGTGLLAILAHKLGAGDILAVDNDDWCIENASENIVVNNTQSIEIQKVDNAKLNKKFNIIIANINKNIILDNLRFLAEATLPGGVVLLSGLLVEDEPEIEAACAALGWKHQETRTRNNWIALHYSV